MSRYDDEDNLEPEEEEEYFDEVEPQNSDRGKKRGRSQFIDDDADEDDYDEEEEEEDADDYDDEDYTAGGKGSRKRPAPKRRSAASNFFELEAAVDSDEEEEEEDGEDDFINDAGAEIPDDGGRRMHMRPLPREDEKIVDVDALEREIIRRYAYKPTHAEYDEETTQVEQQALLPSVRDPKLWIVKCAIGREREAAVCLMQKCIDKGLEMQIKSAIALDHLKNYIYIEADKESHVREACKGLRNIYAQKITLVPIREMTDVLSVESKAIDITRDTWVRLKIGKYKGDLAKVVDVDNVRQKVTVKLIPRIDLQALSDKLEGRETKSKKAFVPPPRFMNPDEARDLRIRVERRRDPMTGDYFDSIEGMKFKDGFLYKTVSTKSISTQGVQPTFDELEKFRAPNENGDGDISSLTTLFANRKKGHFLKGDAVVVIKGELKNIKGTVEKVDEDKVYIKPKMEGLPILAIPEKELCKFFKEGNHVKVVTGAHEGATGTVVKVEGHVLIIVSDAAKEEIHVFADDVVESTEVTSGMTKLGDYELRDLVQLDDRNFGVIIRVESEAFQVLKGVPDRAEVLTVKLREIKCKLDRKQSVKDRFGNTIAAQDVVKILQGPCQGKQGPVEHIHRGILFIFDRHHLEHAGFICAKAESCVVVGGSRANGDRNRVPRFQQQTSTRIPASPARSGRGGGALMHFGGRNGGGRGDDALVGSTIKIRKGPFKGYRGRVTGVKGQEVRIELESQMRVVTVRREDISDNVVVTTPYRDSSRFGMGSETPMHPSRTPLHPYMTPMRDSGATPHHDGMRTPMRDRAWNPYTPMTPARESWEDGNPGSWASSPQYQPGSPPRRTYEAPTPGSGWASTPSAGYSDAGTPQDTAAYANAPSPYLPSTPGQAMTPGSASYLPGTPGGQPMTPGAGGLDIMSPIGGENEGLGFMPDILVTVRKHGEDNVGVIQDVLSDGSCKVSIGRGATIITLPTEMDIVPPKKSDRIKIMGGVFRGLTGKLIGVDGTDGIVKVDSTLDVKILDLVMLAKLA